jgi:hypothetical protein
MASGLIGQEKGRVLSGFTSSAAYLSKAGTIKKKNRK